MLKNVFVVGDYFDKKLRNFIFERDACKNYKFVVLRHIDQIYNIRNPIIYFSETWQNTDREILSYLCSIPYTHFIVRTNGKSLENIEIENIFDNLFKEICL